ncbi:peptidase family M3-domain-containing protein [Rhexocercosporidium sp. MPI-PUGE-AT-0058]|nr:peptidase family M3-domain-containing protein [Rhexocercosporidium sp. MPI-PUGE-AT-0058]
MDERGKPKGGREAWFGEIEFEIHEIKKEFPAISIMTGFSAFQPGSPRLMTVRDVQTLAHELGHAVQDFTRCLYALPRDSVEIPSITVERIVSEPKVLRSLSSNYIYERQEYLEAWLESGKPLPSKQAPLDLLESLSNSFKKNELTRLQEFLWMLKFDLTARSYTQEMLENVDLGVDCQRILSESTGVCGTDGSKLGEGKNNTYIFHQGLEHYVTSYYFYLFAMACAEDVFQTYFAKDPLNRKKVFDSGSNSWNIAMYFLHMHKGTTSKRTPRKPSCSPGSCGFRVD